MEAYPSDMFPAAQAATERTEVYPGHTISHGALVRGVSGDRASLSKVLSASTAVLTEKLTAKLNVLRGLDRPLGGGHQNGANLGNFWEPFAKDQPDKVSPTIDQLLAWSPSFYPDIANVPVRSVFTGTAAPERGAVPYYYSRPESRSGDIVGLDQTLSSRALFSRLFPGALVPKADGRRPVVDAVLDNYKRLRDGNRRLSHLDRQRLDTHIERLAELERRLGAGRNASCGMLMPPTEEAFDLGDTYRDPAGATKKFQLINDVLAFALTCGATRVAVVTVGDSFSSYPGSWHGEVIHRAPYEGDKQKLITESLQRVFEHVFLDLVAKLDIEEAPGSTYLDNSLVMWLQESGVDVAHRSGDQPVVTAGSAHGFLQTGQYVDYRNQVPTSEVWVEGTLPGGVFSPIRNWSGFTYHQLLTTALLAMGVRPEEYAPGGRPWYGEIDFATTDIENPFRRDHYVPAVLDNASAPMPIITTS
jgi:hypothetical protein